MMRRSTRSGADIARRQAAADGTAVFLFASSESVGRRAEDALAGCRVERSDRWEAVENTLPRTECLLVVLPRLQDPRHLSRLSRLAVLYPSVPTVLATRRDAENVRQVRQVRIDEIVWIRTMDVSLPGAVDRAGARTTFEEIAESVERNDALARLVRRALGAVCRSPGPVPSVKDLADAMGCDRRTLWYHWRRSVPADLTLKRVLDWLRLLRAVGRKSQGRSWAAVANELGVHRQTLSRTAERLTGETLSRAKRRGRARLREAFLAEARSLVAEGRA